jgi:hypothetical protein
MKKLSTQLKTARVEGTYKKHIEKISKKQLLIEDRHGINATIVVSQLRVSA